LKKAGILSLNLAKKKLNLKNSRDL